MRYTRDREKREVDIPVICDGKHWFLVEAKHLDSRLSTSLRTLQQQIGCKHAFPVVLESDFVNKDCFSYRKPIVAPARSLFSQVL